MSVVPFVARYLQSTTDNYRNDNQRLAIPSKRDADVAENATGMGPPRKRRRLQPSESSAIDETRSDVAVLEAEPPGNPIEGIHQLQSELATQRDEIQALQRALARAQSHCRRVDDLLVDGKQRHTLVLNELDSARHSANRANSHIAKLEDALRSAYEQLDEKTLEASSLKEERSAATLMLPQGNKTGEDYLREVRELNQKIVDLAHQIANRDGIASMLSGTSRQKRDFFQDWCVHLLWDQVFSVFCPGVNPTFAAPLGQVASKIPIIRKPFPVCEAYNTAETPD
jgi:uncharacterized phage infection (PIP) family protein YhgE